jgi:N,N'-diacetyllegionaminate synthase
MPHMPKERPSLELTLPGPDDRACLTPGEFARMVEDIRSAETALGDNVELLTPGELNTVRLAKDELIP